MKRPIGLAAQTIPGVSAPRLVELAAIAGFDRVGFGVDPEYWTRQHVAVVRRALSDHGIIPQDVEVICLHDRVTDAMRRRIDVAAELGAGWVITISFSPDAAATRDLLASLAEHASGSGVAPILEFGRFTAVGSLTEARTIAEAAGVPLLADPLHLARCGDALDAVASVPFSLLPYAQLCDAWPAAAASDPRSLLDEARERRVNIGEGMLDLRGFLTALPPGTPLMNEVRSTGLASRFADAEAHARHLGSTMRRWLEAAG